MFTEIPDTWKKMDAVQPIHDQNLPVRQTYQQYPTYCRMALLGIATHQKEDGASCQPSLKPVNSADLFRYFAHSLSYRYQSVTT